MTVKKLETQLWLSQPLEEIWEFHCDPQNLVKISPDFLKLSLENVPYPLAKGSKFQIHSENRWLKNFFKWNVEYVDWHEEPDLKYFIDLQNSGPFESWRHKHEFKRGIKEVIVDDKKFPIKNEGTWLVDSVEYSLKPQLRKFGWVAEKVVTQLFVFRKRRLEKIFKRNA
ncbi:MAG: hypothetical protein R3A80_04710 [Bdellovibrionota bacterium]